MRPLIQNNARPLNSILKFRALKGQSPCLGSKARTHAHTHTHILRTEPQPAGTDMRTTHALSPLPRPYYVACIPNKQHTQLTAPLLPPTHTHLSWPELRLPSLAPSCPRIRCPSFVIPSSPFRFPRSPLSTVSIAVPHSFSTVLFCLPLVLLLDLHPRSLLGLVSSFNLRPSSLDSKNSCKLYFKLLHLRASPGRSLLGLV